MKKMIKTQKYIEKQLHLDRYSNGQLAVFVTGYLREPIAELSIRNDLVELAPNEFILKDYSENQVIADNFFEKGFIKSTNRFILVGSRFCPICQIGS